MTKKYTIYEPHVGAPNSGRIISCVVCVNVLMPKQGPVPEGGIAIVHGESDPDSQRIEHGKIVPKGIQDRTRQTTEQGWFELRSKRRQLLAQTDFMANGDYPSSEEERRALRLKRSKTRKIPQKVKDPAKAMLLLERIWSTKDVE
ncbi:MAG: phage tail assembly chaperone [Sulfitobacter sp.]